MPFILTLGKGTADMKKTGPTIKDIAKWADVSIATVSMILNHKDASITAATRDRVLKVIRDNNYIPNKMAGSLVTRRTSTIGLIIPDIVNPFFPELARGAEDKANEAGYNIIFCNTDDDLQKEENYIKMLAEKMVDGIIFAQSAKRTGDIPGIARTAIPIVLIDRNKESPNIRGKVLVDNETGAYRARPRRRLGLADPADRRGVNHGNHPGPDGGIQTGLAGRPGSFQ